MVGKIYKYKCDKCNLIFEKRTEEEIRCDCGSYCVTHIHTRTVETVPQVKEEKRYKLPPMVESKTHEEYLADVVDEFEHEANTILNELAKAKDRLNTILDEIDERMNKTV